MLYRVVVLTVLTLFVVFSIGIGSANAQNLPSSLHAFLGVHIVRDLVDGGGGIAGDLDLSYNFNRFAITGDARSAIGLSDSIWAFRAGSIGARYYLLEGGFSPYVGAGLSVMQLEQTILLVSQDNIGPGIFGSIGIETGRKSKNRFRLQIRIDRPFFVSQEVIVPEGVTYTGEGNVWDGTFAPITIGLGYTRTF